MNITMKNPFLGAHMSIAGGFKNALISGEQLGCTAIQIFTASNRQWMASKIYEHQVETFLSIKKKSPIQCILSHASYLINLGSPNRSVSHKSIHALKEELTRCHMLEIPYVVIHPGAHLDSDEISCIERIATHIDEILDTMGGACHILLENTAGQGSTIGHRFEQLASIRDKIDHKQWVGFCIDTCHAFAAGYDFRREEDYQTMWHEIDKTIGREQVKALHLNDSKKPFGSHIDRHEDIGKGSIGLIGFTHIMNDHKLLHIPKLLETPHTSTNLLDNYSRNMETLKNLIN